MYFCVTVSQIISNNLDAARVDLEIRIAVCVTVSQIISNNLDAARVDLEIRIAVLCLMLTSAHSYRTQ